MVTEAYIATICLLVLGFYLYDRKRLESNYLSPTIRHHVLEGIEALDQEGWYR